MKNNILNQIFSASSCCCKVSQSTYARVINVNSARQFGDKIRKLICIAICFSVISCVSTGGGTKTDRELPKPLNDRELSYISQVEKDGRLIYEKDIRAAYATDLLLRKINPSDYPNFVGWVVYPNRDDFTVSFYERDRDGFKIIADVIYSSNDEPKLELLPSREASGAEKSMIRARIAALEIGANGCSDRFNTVIIPSQFDSNWDVYVLAATTDPNLVLMGGHTKITVSKSTYEVMSTTPLSNSCLALDKSGSDLPEGASISALTVSHIVSPMPIAIHPYLNLLHNINLAIMSERGLWMVSSGKIDLL